MATPVGSRPVKTLNRSGAPPPAPGAASAVPPIPGTVPPSNLPAESRAATVPRQIDVNRIGVVFVHGIGTQPACETFLD